MNRSGPTSALAGPTIVDASSAGQPRSGTKAVGSVVSKVIGGASISGLTLSVTSRAASLRQQVLGVGTATP